MDKKYVHLIMALLLCVTIFFSVWYYVESTRYQLCTVSTVPVVCEVDRKTGYVWLISPIKGIKARRIK